MEFLASTSVITILTLITAVVHLFLGINGGLSLDPSHGLNILFVLNGIGYIYLVLAVFWIPNFLKDQNPLLRRVFIGYVLVTIVLYFVINGLEGVTSAVGMFTKVVEVLLLIGIWQSSKTK
ncbi:MAG: hypothetical protein H6636_07750 [Anaerolineales bacterium]|nr:hypothetical protein [Anaerolineales bacterium]